MKTEYFEHRITAKFIGEIQIVLSIVVLISGIISMISFFSSLENKVGHERDLVMGFVTYSVLTIIVALIDIVFAVVLISATHKFSLPRCLLWKGSASATLVLFGLLTISFLSMMKSPIILLGFLPTLLFKPFALWIVNGFINELRELENFPGNPISNNVPQARSIGLEVPHQLNRTTAFRNESVIRPPPVVASRIATIPEEGP